jgi:ABC-2 type transport system permease protein
MNALLRAEARRLAATGTTWWLLLGTVGIGIIGTIAPLIATDATPARLSDAGLQESLHGAAAGSTLVLVAGILAMAGDWRHGQATQTFLTTPARHRVVAARALSHLGLGTAFGVVAAASSTLAAWAWYRSEGFALPLDRSAVWLTLAGCVAGSAAFGILGVAIGGISRNQVGAIVGALAWLILLEPALFAAVPTAARWLPGMASLAVARQPDANLLPLGAAAAVLTGVVVVALALATRLVARDDIAA